MAVNNVNSNAPANMQPWVREVEAELDRLERLLRAAGVS